MVIGKISKDQWSLEWEYFSKEYTKIILKMLAIVLHKTLPKFISGLRWNICTDNVWQKAPELNERSNKTSRATQVRTITDVSTLPVDLCPLAESQLQALRKIRLRPQMVLLGSPPGKVWPDWVLMRKGGGLVASLITGIQYLTQSHIRKERRKEGLLGP